MKKFFAIVLAVFAISTAAAQPPQGGRGQGAGPNGGQPQPNRRIEALKEALEMSDEQAEKFAPIYMQYQREIRNIQKDLKMVMDSYKDEEITEKVAAQLVMAQLNADADVISCKKEYLRVFKSYLTPSQISKIFLVEKRLGRPRQGGPRPQGDAAPQPQQ